MDENLTTQQKQPEPENSLPMEEVTAAAEALEAAEPVDMAVPAEIEEEAPVKRNWKKILLAGVVVLLVVLGGVGFAWVRWGLPVYQYRQAGKCYANGEYQRARELYISLADYMDSPDRLEEIGYEPAIGAWEKMVEDQWFELDYSYYDLRIEPISYFTTETTAEEFASVFMHMFRNGFEHFSLPAKGVSKRDMDAIWDRIHTGYDLADECLPEYGSVYESQDHYYYWEYDYVTKVTLGFDKYDLYTTDELKQHVGIIDDFCEKPVSGLMDTGLLGSCMSNRQKAKIIYDWVCYYLTYDDTKEIHDTGVAITKKLGVCESYVGLYNRMCNLAGIPTYGQSGDTSSDDSSAGHIWSVQLDEDGTIFYTDATWGDEIDIDFSNSETEPTIERFYETVYKSNMDKKEEHLSINPDELGEMLDEYYWKFGNALDPYYFWQNRKWNGHIEDRPAEKIIACGFHNAAEKTT